MLFRRKNKIDESGRVPVTGTQIEQARQRCLQIVKKRAAMSAGVAAIPLPGMDILADATGFAVLVDEVNKEFGLSQAQIEKLTPRLRRIAYEAAASVGGMMVGKRVARGLVMRLFKRSAGKMAAKSTAKFVPLAGQLASAAIGYALFKKMGDQHVEACAKVARALEAETGKEFESMSPTPGAGKGFEGESPMPVM